ncbi:hypothetical protein B0H10DRAFT_1940813 [Mycena sp. CBHHK59/15]|nr:hypothetical protein B0H10DRAFT_1940813 [Mycena sp. CBHHK59/15]
MRRRRRKCLAASGACTGWTYSPVAVVVAGRNPQCANHDELVGGAGHELGYSGEPGVDVLPWHGRAMTQSVLERRRQLEADLAALLPVPSPLSSLPRHRPRQGRSTSMWGRVRRARTHSSAAFGKVEAPSDGEGYDARDEREFPGPQAHGSWFGGGAYEWVKAEFAGKMIRALKGERAIVALQGRSPHKKRSWSGQLFRSSRLTSRPSAHSDAVQGVIYIRL